MSDIAGEDVPRRWADVTSFLTVASVWIAHLVVAAQGVILLGGDHRLSLASQPRLS